MNTLVMQPLLFDSSNIVHHQARSKGVYERSWRELIVPAATPEIHQGFNEAKGIRKRREGGKCV